MAKKVKTFAEMSVDQLHDAATKAKLEGRSSMNKEQLIAALEEKAKAKEAEVEEPEATAATAEAPCPLTISSPAEVQCHSDFLVHWTAAEGLTNVIIGGHGNVTTSPVTAHSFQQGPMTFCISAKDAEGKDVSATCTTNVVKPK